MADAPVVLEQVEITPAGIQTAAGKVCLFRSSAGPMATLPAHAGLFLTRDQALHLAAVLVAIAGPPGGES